MNFNLQTFMRQDTYKCRHSKLKFFTFKLSHICLLHAKLQRIHVLLFTISNKNVHARLNKARGCNHGKMTHQLF